MVKATKKLARIEEVDLLRGLAILAMVSLHTNAYFLSNPLSFFTWDYGQFAVPIFIFCSTYLFFKKDYQFNSIKDALTYVKKRVIRLLIPYYIFVAVFACLVYLREPAKITINYLFQNAVMMGGIDINWLVILFIYFSFLLPFLSYTKNKRPSWWWIFLVVSLISSIIFLFYRPTYNYRYVMWLPWSLLVIFTQVFALNEAKTIFFLLTGVFSFIVFLGLRFLEAYLKHSLLQYDNKYPPNLYHIAFGVFSIILFYVLAKKRIFSLPIIKPILIFLSKNSYPIYFVHYCIIFVLWVFFKFKFNWITFFITITALTIGVQALFNKVLALVRNHFFSAL